MADSQAVILVADDSWEMRALVAAVVRSLGGVCLEAATGTDALKLLRQDFRISAVVTDLEMPGLDGLRLTRQIRRDPRLQDLPVLLYSAAIDERVRAQAQEVGVTRSLPKTGALHDLRNELQRLLELGGTPAIARALVVGIPPEEAAGLCSVLSDSGFQILQVTDEGQARGLVKQLDSLDLAFMKHAPPDDAPHVLVHHFRSPQDYNLFRLVLLMGELFGSDRVQSGPVCLAARLTSPPSLSHVRSLLRRLSLLRGSAAPSRPRP